MKNTSKFGRLGWFGLLAAVMLGTAAWGAFPSVAAAEGTPGAGAPAACGAKDNPCPLQKWMKTNVGVTLAGNDLPALAKVLDKAATFSPDPSWEWATIAKAGADAARKGDVAGAKASCKSCHDKYKDSYKSKFRTKAVN